MNRSYVGIFMLVLGAAGPLYGSTSPKVPTLAEVVQCNARAAGAGALAALGAVAYRLEIAEPGFIAQAYYRVTREGRMRIDIHVDGDRVFSEGHDGKTAWSWKAGDDHAVPAGEQGEAALRHGVEQPGHLYALIHLPDNGHQMRLAGMDNDGDREYAVIEVILSDGFRQWYWVNRESCLIERNRSFRAFHPDLDSTEKWVETRFSDFRDIDGVTRAFTSENVDLASGEILGTTRILEYIPDPDLAPGEFEAP